MSTGVHLFREQTAASDFVARFVTRSKRLAGGAIGPHRIESVTEVTMPGLGDGVVAIELVTSASHRVTVLARRGRVIGETIVERDDAAHARSEAMTLARKLDSRIASVLAAAARR